MHRHRKKKLLRMGLSLSLVMACAAFLPAQKVKTVDGVKVIQNNSKPKAPKGVPTKITFHEELSVGGGDDPETSFSEVGLFVVSDDGAIYGLDMKARNIKVYDAEGELLAVIATDVFDPNCKNMDLAVDSKGQVYIVDTVRLQIHVFVRENGEPRGGQP